VFLDGRSPELVKSLIETNTFGTPPLVIAARNGHLDVVKYLVSYLTTCFYIVLTI
jgi:ankyrin repeat protein